MSQQVLELLILGVVAAIVIGRLLSVLGQKRGAEGPSAAPPVAVEVGAGSSGPAMAPAPVALPGGSGVQSVIQADPGFDPAQFIEGARTAYEMIVTAFAAGDLAAMQPLLNPRVFEVYAGAIGARKEGDPKGPDLVRLRSAELVDARMEGDIARVTVRYEAELAEGQVGLRETREKWTFERDVRSRDPNWRLSAVAQA